MSSAQLPKLTKKQKKGIAFRERKQGKSSKGKNDQPDGEGGGQDVPIQEAVDQAEIQDSDVEMEKAASTRSKETTDKRGKGKGIPVREDAKVVESAKKRKREEGETHEGAHEGAHEGEKPKQKKLKSGSEDGAKAEKDLSNRGKQRFILFVGMILVCIRHHPRLTRHRR
jgi:nucleolar protein 6